MKKIILYFFIVLFIISTNNFCSSNEKSNQKATTIDELIDKYNGAKFKNCDDFFNFGHEYLDVMVSSIERALLGDEKVFDDFDKINVFFAQFEEQQIEFENICPEKFEEFVIKAEERLENPMKKLFEYLNKGMIN